MTESQSDAKASDLPGRRLFLVLLTIGFAGVALRGLVRPGFGLGYDEGVYYSAAAAWVVGWEPYVDFSFVHPPGILALLWPSALAGEHLIGHAAGYLLAKAVVGLAVLAVIVGIGVLAYRWQGPMAAVLAAVLYAGFQPAVSHELPVRLEPFVNLAFVAAALVWLRGPIQARTDRRTAISAVLAGLAAATKLTGGVVLVGLLASRPFARPLAHRLVVCGIALGAGLLLVTPFAIRDWQAVWEQVVLTQLARPGGDMRGSSITDPITRIAHMLQVGPSYEWSAASPGVVAGVLLAAHGLAAGWAWLRGGPDGRFWASTGVATVLILLSAPSYYSPYPLLLAVPSSMLLSGGLIRAMALLNAGRRTVAVAFAAVVLLVVIPLGEVVNRQLALRPIDRAAAIRQLVPAGECVTTDPATLGIAADRLPPADENGPLVDPFGELMHLALRDGARYSSIDEALWSDASQERLRTALLACRYAASLYAIDYQPRLSPSTRTWFQQTFELVGEPINGVSVWRR